MILSFFYSGNTTGKLAVECTLIHNASWVVIFRFPWKANQDTNQLPNKEDTFLKSIPRQVFQWYFRNEKIIGSSDSVQVLHFTISNNWEQSAAVD